MKRILSLLLIFAISTVFADGVMPAGHGTEEEPYQIATLDNLLWLSTSGMWFSYYIQTADIDASDTQNWNDGEGFSPIGEDYPNLFSGSYDGQGYSISSLYINRNSAYRVGFFGIIRSASISNLDIIDANVTGGYYVGIIAGYATNSVITNCYTTGSAHGQSSIGGILGESDSNECTSCNTDVETVAINWETGGFVGYDRDSIYFTCYSSGSVTGNSRVGGFAGSSNGSTFLNCSSDSAVDGDQYIGGFVGVLFYGGELTSCSSQGDICGVSYIGGIAGETYGDCYLSCCCRLGDVGGSYSCAGGIIGWARDLCVVDLCRVEGDVSGYYYVGGIIGYSDECAIRNSRFEGNLSGDTHVKGIAGFMKESTIDNSFYNYEYYTINQQHIATPGAIGNEMYYEWKFAGMTLDIDNYFVRDGEYYLLEDCRDLRNLLGFCMLDGYSFRLTGDIDMQEFPGLCIPVFKSALYGNGYTISNLSITVPINNDVGFIGYAENAALYDIVIDGAVVEGRDNVGIMIGKSNRSEVTRCSTSGTVTGQNSVGGMIGSDYHTSAISGCYSTADVSADGFAGGFMGITNHFSSISDCYCRGDVEADSLSGGFIGKNVSFGSIHRCYSTGLVEGNANIGGFSGASFDDAMITGSFWDTDSSHQEESAGGAGLPTTQMTFPIVYLDFGWDFEGESDNGTDDIWGYDEGLNDGYPYLSWQSFTPNDDVTTDPPELLTFRLEPNHPNPFNPTTTISFSIPKEDRTVLKVYNIRGQMVRELVNEKLDAGWHRATWNGDDTTGKSVSSGIYLYRLESGGRTQTGKMSLLK